MTLTEEQREAIRVISKLPMAIGCQLCHPYIMKNYGSHFIVLRDMIDSSGTVEPTGGFDLERARGLRDFLQDDCAEVGDVWGEMIAEIERLRSAALRGNQLISELMANCNSLRARAWKAEARIKELEEALVEERDNANRSGTGYILMSYLKENNIDPDKYFYENAKEHLQAEGKIGPDAALKKQWDEVLSEAAIHKKMEELPTAPGAYRPAIREEAIRQLNTMRSWQITEEATR